MPIVVAILSLSDLVRIWKEIALVFGWKEYAIPLFLKSMHESTRAMCFFLSVDFFLAIILDHLSFYIKHGTYNLFVCDRCMLHFVRIEQCIFFLSHKYELP